MNAEEILKLLREGSKEVMEGLETLEGMGKTLSTVALNLSTAAQQGKKLMEIMDRISKKVPPHKP